MLYLQHARYYCIHCDVTSVSYLHMLGPEIVTFGSTLSVNETTATLASHRIATIQNVNILFISCYVILLTSYCFINQHLIILIGIPGLFISLVMMLLLKCWLINGLCYCNKCDGVQMNWRNSITVYRCTNVTVYICTSATA